ncbi:hypothetical protein [Microbulbifer sp. THAF38]|uniref:hypothetical protein n=1 Tax=Microbulbifer sp. THAF38 TaxID=2587856 RepID=UPI001268B0FC|nr:hypothetical protein [Microbulbifer sp. THAF38]
MKNSSNNIRSLKRRHQGEVGVVLANGPSALSYEKKSDSIVHIGLNASPLLEERCGLSLDYYVLTDRRFLQNPEKRPIADTMLERDTPCILREELSADLTKTNDNTFFVRSIGRDGFSTDLESGFYFGCSTTMLALQLAYYLGLKKIYLVGVDLKYKPEQPRFYMEKVVEPNDPFTSVQVWNFSNAYQTLKMLDVDLFLCSEESLARPYIPFLDVKDI